MQLVEWLEAVPCSQMIGRHLGCRTGICFWRETYHNRRAADWGDTVGVTQSSCYQQKADLGVLLRVASSGGAWY